MPVPSHPRLAPTAMPTVALTPTPLSSSHHPRPALGISPDRASAVRCPACGRVEPRPADALRRLARGLWQECCGRVMVPASDAETVPDLDPIPWADRRLHPRRSPRPGARAEVRRGALGAAPDVAVGLLDVSEGGARVRVRGRLRPGDRVLVSVFPPGGVWVAGGPAEVRWCEPAVDGTSAAGIRFDRPLSARHVAELAE
jgi:hypothetical protein